MSQTMTETVELRLANEEAGKEKAFCDCCGRELPLDELTATGSFGETGLMCIDGIACDRSYNNQN